MTPTQRHLLLTSHICFFQGRNLATAQFFTTWRCGRGAENRTVDSLSLLVPPRPLPHLAERERAAAGTAGFQGFVLSRAGSMIRGLREGGGAGGRESVVRAWQTSGGAGTEEKENWAGRRVAAPTRTGAQIGSLAAIPLCVWSERKGVASSQLSDRGLGGVAPCREKPSPARLLNALHRGGGRPD